MLRRAKGEDAIADALIASLEQMVQTDHDRQLLATAKARAGVGRSLPDAIRSLAKASNP
jgi:hypothetical protein